MRTKRPIPLVLCLALLLPVFAWASALPARAEAPSTVIGWENARGAFTVSGANYLTKTDVSSDVSVGVPYLHMVVTDFKETNSGTSGKLVLDGRTLGFSSAIAQNDWILIRAIVRAAKDSAAVPVKFQPALFNCAQNATANSGAAVTAGSDWTEIRMPIRATSATAVDSAVLRMSYQLQSVDLAFFEILNYGETSCSSMAGSTVLTAAEVKNAVFGEKLAMSWEHFYANARQNSTANSALSRPDASVSGFPYLSAAVTNVVLQDNGNPNMNRSMTIASLPEGAAFAQNDWVLVRAILRTAPGSANETGQCQFRFFNGTKTVHQIPSFTFGADWTEVVASYRLTSADAPTIDRFDLAEGFRLQTVEIAYLEILDLGAVDPSSYACNRPLSDFEAVNGALSGGTEHMETEFTSAFSGAPAGDAKFPGAVRLTSSLSVTPGADADAVAEAGGVTLLSFALKAPEVCTKVLITVNAAQSETWYIPTGWSRVFMAIRSRALSSVAFSFEGELLLGEAKVADRGDASAEDLWNEGGMRLLEDFETVTLPQTGLGTGTLRGMVSSGDTLYAIGGGMLHIVDISTPGSERLLSSIGGMGSSIRQIALCGSGEDVIITSREARAFIVNVSDPEHPTIRAHCDSLEMATGVCTYGDYAFIANRQYGVEAIDLTDPDHPRHVANIDTGEAQSCCVSDGVLYCGLWGECRVDLYDVRDPAHAAYLGSCPLSGKGDGVFVKKVSGRTILFAATGHHSKPGVAVTDNTVLAFGNGNGLDLFDVTDPASPVWLSTSRIDGRYYFANYDYWKVAVAEVGEKLLAYLVNTYNGVTVLDVTDLRAPVRLAHIKVQLDAVTPQVFAGRQSIFPYDQYAVSQSPVGGVVAAPGALYLAGVMSDLHVVQNAALFGAEASLSQAVPLDCSEDFYEQDLAPLGEGVLRYAPGGQVYTVVAEGGRIYAACGSDGVLVLNRDLELLARIPTADLAEDLQFKNGLAYVAESMEGLGIYEVSSDGLSFTFLRRYQEADRPITQVRLSETGKFIAAQISSNSVAILRGSDLARLWSKKGNTQAYHHNLLPAVFKGRYLFFWTDTGPIQVFDCGENDEFDTPVWITTTDPTYSFTGGSVSIFGGFTVFGDRIIGVGKGRYYLFDPSSRDHADLSDVTWVPIPGVTSAGKPSVFGDLLVISDRCYGKFFLVDLSDPASPVLLRQFDFQGNPDLATLAGGSLYLPLSCQGVVKLPLTARELALTGAASSDLRIAGRTLTFDSAFSARYLLEKDAFDAYLAAGMTVESFTVAVNGETRDLSDVIGSDRVVVIDGCAYYWTKVSGIAAKDIETPYTFTLVTSFAGETYTDVFPDSVAAALTDAAANAPGTAFADAANAALATCKAAADAFGVTNSISFAPVPNAPARAPIAEVSSGSGAVTLCGTSILLKDELAIKFWARRGSYAGSLENLTVKVNGAAVEAEKAENGNYITFKIPVPVDQAETAMTAEVFSGGASVSNRYTDSVLNYALSMTDAALGQAIINYVHYANVYLSGSGTAADPSVPSGDELPGVVRP